MIRIELRQKLSEFELEVALHLGAGCTGIFGPSGSGKTSLLEAVAGWRRSAAGLVRVGTQVLLDPAAGIDLPPEQRALGYVPQDVLLLPHWNVRQNLVAGGKLDALVLQTFELEALLERDVRSLSGGERQRVALARALLACPRLLLLDEPLTGLDRERRRRALALLLSVKERFAIPMLFVTHDATDVQVLCDEVVVLERGRVRAQGRPAEILAREPGAAFENVLRGTMGPLEGGGAELELAPDLVVQVGEHALPAGTRAVFALPSEDVLLARGALPRISARNRLRGLVRALRDVQGEVQVEVEVRGARLFARVTQAAQRELELEPGVEVQLLFKATSCRLVAA